jgi:hypothetical protein
VATTLMVSQTTHGLAVKDVVRHKGTSWTKSQADSAANAVVGGIVIAVLSPDVFVLATGGYVAGLSGLTAGSVHYLSAATAGALTTTAPTIAVPVLMATGVSAGVLRIPYVQSVANSTSLKTTLTSGSSYSIPSDVTLCRFVLIGGGGDAGASLTDNSGLYVATSSGGSPTAQLVASGGGGGGGSGGVTVIEKMKTGIASVSYSIGAAGSSGDGGNTTLTISGTTYTAYGGKVGESARMDGNLLLAGRGGEGGLGVTYDGLFDSWHINGRSGGTGISGTTYSTVGGAKWVDGQSGMPAYGPSYGKGGGTYNAAFTSPNAGAIYVIKVY